MDEPGGLSYQLSQRLVRFVLGCLCLLCICFLGGRGLSCFLHLSLFLLPHLPRLLLLAVALFVARTNPVSSALGPAAVAATVPGTRRGFYRDSRPRAGSRTRSSGREAGRGPPRSGTSGRWRRQVEKLEGAARSHRPQPPAGCTLPPCVWRRSRFGRRSVSRSERRPGPPLGVV